MRMLHLGYPLNGLAKESFGCIQLAERTLTSKEATLGGQKLLVCLHNNVCKCQRRERKRLFHDKQAELSRNPTIYHATSWEQPWDFQWRYYAARASSVSGNGHNRMACLDEGICDVGLSRAAASLPVLINPLL